MAGIEIYPDTKAKFNDACLRRRCADVMEALICCFLENETLQADVQRRVGMPSDRPPNQPRGRSEVHDIGGSLERYKSMVTAQNPGKSLAETTTCLVESFLENQWVRGLVRERVGLIVIPDLQQCMIPETAPMLTR